MICQREYGSHKNVVITNKKIYDFNNIPIQVHFDYIDNVLTAATSKSILKVKCGYFVSKACTT